MEDNCVFCKIVTKQAPAQIVYQDDEVTAFKDAHPIAPVHILIVPNRHITSVNDLQPDDNALMGKMILLARSLAAENGVSESGYRLMINTGKNGGQSVFHLHLHLIGGRRLFLGGL